MVAACSGGGRLSTLPTTPGGSKSTDNLASSVPLVTNATLLRPLQMVNTAYMALSGTTLCGTPLSGTTCLGASAPAYTTPVESNVLLLQVNRNAACTPPGVTLGYALLSSHTMAGTPPTPVPGPTATPYPTTSSPVPSACPSGKPGDEKSAHEAGRRVQSGRRLDDGVGIIRDCNGDLHSNNHNGHGNDNNPQTTSH